MVTEQLAELVRAALHDAVAQGTVDPPGTVDVEFERPKRPEHGDWATNVALVAAGGRRNPRDIAKAIADRLQETPLLERVEVAGPGFLNFRLAPEWFHDVVRRAADPSSGFGRSAHGAGSKINVEYVSANPTGPLNVVSGRHAAVGDAVSNLLEAEGWSVVREYYVNDVGRQIRLFAESIAARYLQIFGRDAAVPEGGYEGDYIVDLAKDIASEIGESLVDGDAERRIEQIRRVGLERMIASARRSLERFGTRHSVWFRESSLHDSGLVGRAVQELESRELIEERDGAKWFRSSQFGDDKDRVIIRASGEPTYLASDAAYLLDKFGRGFDHLLYVWGADHHGTVRRLVAAAEGLGFDRAACEVRIIQNVSILRGGETVKASKRAGVVVPLDELIDEVGVDAARYTFLTRSLDAPLDFDIELAKEQAPENPVFYVQYAHARICSILRKALEEGIEADTSEAPLELLVHPQEDRLMRKLDSFEEVVPDAALNRAPQKVTRYAEELASTFSAFYRDCRVISDDRRLTAARLSLCIATKSVLAMAMGLLSVNAPERM